MNDGFRGITDHTITWDDRIPVSITMDLGRGRKVEVNLINKQLTQLEGRPLKDKQRDWVMHMAEYLMRQALLKRHEDETGEKSPGAKPVTFSARPNPDVTWWG
uniref:Uncharacterized protein n=1 Tax=Magnetococcus massalia (strain MO-1) TaxID=451514 RepID=A0A1S7LNK9_MAGMO|nr:protein of unknown function.Similar to protein mmc1_3701 from Magnetococcus sp. (strain MC-1) [Candidatus Magnetococcus massalia]